MKKKTKVNYYRKVLLPHIRTTVTFTDITNLQGIDIGNAGGYCVEVSENFQSTGETDIYIFLRDIKKNVKKMRYMPYIAHEILHAIQIICTNLHMRIEEEKEHTAYIMHYLMEELIK